MRKRELDAVVAHDAWHIRSRDSSLMTMATCSQVSSRSTRSHPLDSRIAAPEEAGGFQLPEQLSLDEPLATKPALVSPRVPRAEGTSNSNSASAQSGR